MEPVTRTKNILLAKDDVGKPKQLNVPLPPKEFVYGKSESRDAANVALLTSNWLQHAKSRAKSKEQVDFKKLNKYSTAAFNDLNKDRAKCNSIRVSAIFAITSCSNGLNIFRLKRDLKENANFRMSRNQSHRKVGYISGIVKANNVVSSSANVTQSMTFGKANRPSTPIQGVISNNYANIAA